MAFNKRESVVIGSSLDNIQLVWCKYLYYFFRLKGTHMQAQLCGKKLSLQFIQITSFAPAGLVIIGHCWWTIFPCITNWRRMGSTEPRHQPPNSQTCKKRKKNWLLLTTLPDVILHHLTWAWMVFRSASNTRYEAECTGRASPVSIHCSAIFVCRLVEEKQTGRFCNTEYTSLSLVASRLPNWAHRH